MGLEQPGKNVQDRISHVQTAEIGLIWINIIKKSFTMDYNRIF